MSRMMLRCVLLTSLLLVAAADAATAQLPGWSYVEPFMPHRGRIGLHVQPMTPELREHFNAPPDRGLLVTRVEPDRPAARAGVRVGDVVVSANGEPLRQPYDLMRALGRVPTGQALELRILRDTEDHTLTVEPEGAAAPWVDPGPWRDWLEQGARRGSEELRRQLRQLEQRLKELERQFEEHQQHQDDEHQQT